MSEVPESDIGEATSVQAKDASQGTIPSEHKLPSTIEPNTYNVKPSMEDRFKSSIVENLIRDVLTQELSGKVYTTKSIKQWTENIANTINQRVRDLKLKRYKHIVHVIIGEQRGAGVKSGVKCVWDSETDSYASDIFINESLFCMAAVFAIYFY